MTLSQGHQPPQNSPFRMRAAWRQSSFHISAGVGGTVEIVVVGNPSKSGTRAWGFRLREARNKALRLRAIPNICLSYELGCGADAGRAHYAALFHQRLHFT
jgi:hypothetical protein